MPDGDDKIACDDCAAIARELRTAYIETWLSAGPEFREAWLAATKLKGGTEDDVLRAEALFPKAQLKSSPRIGDALRRKFVHEATTGHTVPKPAADIP